ncbi:hypothetical protein CAEBREN_11320 [Caenorhabditis brenneri]|uniref:Uncharacterized protein n=1 Tax=Caenorhabditis brenneri TaxID=135651 RepID=G0MWA2_CAEBE|nr:hypothetical protein CAEBREN_11320 [Caenorhabditis brenneri]
MGPGSDQDSPNRPSLVPGPPADNTNGLAINRDVNNISSKPSSGFSTGKSYRPTYSRRTSFLDPNLMPPPLFPTNGMNQPQYRPPRIQINYQRGVFQKPKRPSPMRNPSMGAPPVPPPQMTAPPPPPPEMVAQQMQHPPPVDAQQVHYSQTMDAQSYPPPFEAQQVHNSAPMYVQQMYHPPPADAQGQIHHSVPMDEHQMSYPPPVYAQQMNFSQMGHSTMGYIAGGYAQHGYPVVAPPPMNYQPMQVCPQYEAPPMGVRPAMMPANGVPPNPIPGPPQTGLVEANETQPEKQSEVREAASCQQLRADGDAKQIFPTPSFSPQSMFSPGQNSFPGIINTCLEAVQLSGAEIHARLDGQSEEFRSLHKKVDMITNFLQQDVLPVVHILKRLNLKGNEAPVLDDNSLQNTQEEELPSGVGEILCSSTAFESNDQASPSLPDDMHEDGTVALVTTPIKKTDEKKEKKSKTPQSSNVGATRKLKALEKNQPVVLLKKEQKEQQQHSKKKGTSIQQSSAPSDEQIAVGVTEILPNQGKSEEVPKEPHDESSEDDNCETEATNHSELETTDAAGLELEEEQEGVLENGELADTQATSLVVLEEPERQHEDQVVDNDDDLAQVPEDANPGDNLKEVDNHNLTAVHPAGADFQTDAENPVSNETNAPKQIKKEKKKAQKSPIDNDRMSRKLKAFEKMNRCGNNSNRNSSKSSKQQKKTKRMERDAPKPNLTFPSTNHNPGQKYNSSTDDHLNETLSAPMEKQSLVEQEPDPDAESVNSGNATAGTIEAAGKLEEPVEPESSDKKNSEKAAALFGDAHVDLSGSDFISTSIISPETSAQDSSQETSDTNVPTSDNEFEVRAPRNGQNQLAAKKLSKKQKKKLAKNHRTAVRTSDEQKIPKTVEAVTIEEFHEVTDPEELTMVMSTMDYWDDTNITHNHCYEIEDEHDTVKRSRTEAIEDIIHQLEETSQPDESTTPEQSLDIQPDTELNVPGSNNEVSFGEKEGDGEEKESEGASNDDEMTTTSIKEKKHVLKFSIEKLLKRIDSLSSKQEEVHVPDTEEAETEDKVLLDMMVCIYQYTKNSYCNRRWFKALAFKSGKGNFFNMEPGSQLEEIALYWENRPFKKWDNWDYERFLKCCESKMHRHYGMGSVEHNVLGLFFKALIQFAILPRTDQFVPLIEQVLEDVTFFEGQFNGGNKDNFWDVEYLKLVDAISVTTYTPIKFPSPIEVKTCSSSQLNEAHINHFLVYLQRQDTLRHSPSDVELMYPEDQVLCKLRQMETSEDTFDAHPFFVEMMSDLNRQRRTVKNYLYKNCYQFLIEIRSVIVAADLKALMELGLVKEKKNNQSNHEVCMNLWFGIQ